MSRRPLTELDLVAIAIFAVAGALVGIAFSVIYVGINYLNVLGVEWHWIWERGY